MARARTIGLILIVALWAGRSAMAVTARLSSGLTLQAARLTYDEQAKTGEAQGSVRVIAPSRRLEADSVRFRLGPRGDALETLEAQGRVRLETASAGGEIGALTATGQRLRLDARTGALTVSGEAVIRASSGNTNFEITGSQVRFQPDRKELFAEGRARLVIPDRGVAVAAPRLLFALATRQVTAEGGATARLSAARPREIEASAHTLTYSREGELVLIGGAKLKMVNPTPAVAGGGDLEGDRVTVRFAEQQIARVEASGAVRLSFAGQEATGAKWDMRAKSEAAVLEPAPGPPGAMSATLTGAAALEGQRTQSDGQRREVQAQAGWMQYDPVSGRLRLSGSVPGETAASPQQAAATIRESAPARTTHIQAPEMVFDLATDKLEASQAAATVTREGETPIELAADSLTYDWQKQALVLQTQARAESADWRMTADRLEVTGTPTGGAGDVAAHGAVHIRLRGRRSPATADEGVAGKRAVSGGSREMSISAQEAQYRSADQTFHASGQVQLAGSETVPASGIQPAGKRELTAAGDEVTYRQDTGEAELRGGWACLREPDRLILIRGRIIQVSMPAHNLTATGPASAIVEVPQQAPLTATADSITYDWESRAAILTGGADLSGPRETISGERIEFSATPQGELQKGVVAGGARLNAHGQTKDGAPWNVDATGNRLETTGPEEVRLTGEVEIRGNQGSPAQGMRQFHATAAEATYDGAHQQITLTGSPNVEVTDAAAARSITLTGPRIVISLETREVHAAGGVRGQITAPAAPARPAGPRKRGQ